MADVHLGQQVHLLTDSHHAESGWTQHLENNLYMRESIEKELPGISYSAFGSVLDSENIVTGS